MFRLACVQVKMGFVNIFCSKGAMARVSACALMSKLSMISIAMIVVLWMSPFMLYMFFHCMEQFHVTEQFTNQQHFPVILFNSIFLQQDKIQMRAYAIVRKQRPNLHEHVITVTREQPKISIDGIIENRTNEPHRAGSPYAHQLHNSGTYFRFSEQEGRLSSRGSLNEKYKEENEEKEEIKIEKEPQAILIAVSEQIHPRATIRTKKLFQEFPSSPSKPKEQQQKQLNLNATPVRLLQNDEEIMQPVEPVGDHHPRKLKIFEHNQLLPIESKNVVYESDSKNFSCCGEVNQKAQKQPQPQPHPSEFQAIIFSKTAQPETHQKHSSGKKHKIFQQFEKKDRIVEQFSSKQDKIQSKVPLDEKEKSIRIKIFQFSSIPPFDI